MIYFFVALFFYELNKNFALKAKNEVDGLLNQKIIYNLLCKVYFFLVVKKRNTKHADFSEDSSGLYEKCMLFFKLIKNKLLITSIKLIELSKVEKSMLM